MEALSEAIGSQCSGEPRAMPAECRDPKDDDLIHMCAVRRANDEREIEEIAMVQSVEAARFIRQFRSGRN